MNDYFRRNLEAGQPCRQWFTDCPSLIPPGSMFETKGTAAVTEFNALKSAIRHLVKLYAANDIGAQAAWTSAAHVEKAPSTGGGGSEEPPTP